MAAHPFGPIEKSLIIAYYKRETFHLQRVRVKKKNMAVINLKTETFAPIYGFMKTEFLVEAMLGEKLKYVSDFKVTIHRKLKKFESFVKDFLGKNLGFGFTISIMRGNGVLDRNSPLSWPEIAVSILGPDYQPTQNFQVKSQNFKMLLKDKQILEFLEPLQVHRQFEVQFTLEGIKFTADGTVLHQFTKFKKLLDPERVKQSSVLRAMCFSVTELSADDVESYFGLLSSYLYSQFERAARCWSLEDERDVYLRTMDNIKTTVSAIEYFFFSIWYQKSFVVFMPVEVLKNLVANVIKQIEECVTQQTEPSTTLKTHLVLVVMTAKNLYLSTKEMFTQDPDSQPINSSDETETYESCLYFVRSDFHESVFFELLNNSTLIEISQYSRLTVNPQIQKEFEFHSNYTNAEIVSTEDQSQKHEIQFSRFWGRQTHLESVQITENKYVCRNRIGTQWMLLDVPAYVAEKTLKKKKKSKHMPGLVSLPDLPFDSCYVYSFSSLGQGLLVFLQIGEKKHEKSVLCYLPLKGTPETNKWVTSEPVDEEIDELPVVFNIEHQSTNYVCGVADFDNEERTDGKVPFRVLCWRFSANMKAIKLEADEVLETANSTDDNRKLLWTEKKKKLFLIAAERSFSEATVFYLHQKKFVRLGFSPKHVPGLHQLRPKRGTTTKNIVVCIYDNNSSLIHDQTSIDGGRFVQHAFYQLTVSW